MANAAPPRWTYRFQNFRRGLALLREAMDLQASRPLSALEQEGAAQRFEYTWELAWKVLKDVLEADGAILPTITPAAAVKAAFAAKLMEDGEGWLAALDARNKLAHVYSASAFAEVTAAIGDRFLALFEALHDRLFERLMAEGWA